MREMATANWLSDPVQKAKEAHTPGELWFHHYHVIEAAYGFHAPIQMLLYWPPLQLPRAWVDTIEGDLLCMPGCVAND